MSDIDVEAVEDIDAPSGVEAPEFVCYGGKGGVGKTTCAAATALASARDGTATLVVSTDPAHSLADTLDVAVPAEPTRIREDVPLFAAEIDPDGAMGEGPFGLDGQLGGLGAMLGGGPGGGAGAGGGTGPGGGDGSSEGAGLGDEPLASSMPGADEAAAMRVLLEYVEDERFDRIVLDTAPTGHTLRLLELPETMDSLLGTILKLRQRLSGMMDGLGGMFAGGDDDADGPMGDTGDIDELRAEIEHLRTLLQDPARTDFRIVMVPEELSVTESTRLLSRLNEYQIPVQTVVVNRVMQPLDAVVDDAAAADHVGPNLEDCAFCARRWDVQQRALASAQDLFQGREVRRVPLLAEEVRGQALLSVVAACLD